VCERNQCGRLRKARRVSSLLFRDRQRVSMTVLRVLWTDEFAYTILSRRCVEPALSLEYENASNNSLPSSANPILSTLWIAKGGQYA